MQPPLPIWRQPDNFSRIAHQRVVDKLNADRPDFTDGQGRKLWTCIGYIVNAGPSDEGGEAQDDFTDARYWVRLADCEPDEAESLAQSDPIRFSGREAVEGQPHIVCATNVAELPLNAAETTEATHDLPMGRHVRVWAIERRGSDGVLATVFEFTAGGGGGLPPGTGRYKVMMLLDDADPGTPGWDYPRFH